MDNLNTTLNTVMTVAGQAGFIAYREFVDDDAAGCGGDGNLGRGLGTGHHALPELLETGKIAVLNAVDDVVPGVLDTMAQENVTMLQASVKIADTSGKNSDEAQSVSAAGEEQSASMHEISDVAGSLAKLATERQNEMQRFKL